MIDPKLVDDQKPVASNAGGGAPLVINQSITDPEPVTDKTSPLRATTAAVLAAPPPLSAAPPSTAPPSAAPPSAAPPSAAPLSAAPPSAAAPLKAN
jgi:hypothetical protein